MLLVASETGHVYTFATRKLQPMITSEAGKTLIQTCLNSPDQPGAGGGSTGGSGADQRMSATGYEETELTYNVPEDISAAEQQQKVGITSYHLSCLGLNIELCTMLRLPFLSFRLDPFLASQLSEVLTRDLDR